MACRTAAWNPDPVPISSTFIFGRTDSSWLWNATV